MEPLIKILTLQQAQHSMASWVLNIDTTTQEKYLAAATNKVYNHRYSVWYALCDISSIIASSYKNFISPFL